MNRSVKYPYVLTDIFLSLVFSVYILFTGFHGYYSILEAKFSCFILIFAGYLCLMLLFTLEMLLLGRLKPVSPVVLWKQANWAQRGAVLYFLSSVVSALLSPHRQETWLGMSRYEGILTLGIYCGCFLCVSVFGRGRWYFKYILGGTMTVFCVICLLQFMGHNPIYLFPEGYSYLGADVAYSGIYLGTIGNVDSVAALLCLVIPLLLWSVLRPSRRSWAILLPLLLCIVVLVIMDVKAGWMGIVLGGLLSLPVVAPVKKEYRKWLWAAVVVLLLSGLLLVYTAPMTGMMYELQQVLHGNWGDHFGSGRVSIWRQVLQKVPDRLFWGVGPDTMYAAGIRLGTVIIDCAHNEYLNVLFHQGLFGLFSYLMILITQTVGWLRRGADRFWACPFGCAVLCYSIQAFFGLSICMTAGMFWVVLGLLNGALSEKGEDIDERK